MIVRPVPGGDRGRHRRTCRAAGSAARGGPWWPPTAVGRRGRVGDRVGHEPLDQRVDVAVQGGREEQPLAARRASWPSSSVTSGRKPMSAIWSASSSTVISTSSSWQTPRSIRSPSRPGVATRSSTPRRSASIWRSYGHAADGGLEEEPDGLAERHQRVVDLHGQLAGRHQDQGLRVVRPGPAARGEPGEQRQAEGERLAGAGLAAAEHVPAGERVGDGGRLDRERRGDALPGQRADQLLGQAEGGEADRLGGRSARARPARRRSLPVRCRPRSERRRAAPGRRRSPGLRRKRTERCWGQQRWSRNTFQAGRIFAMACRGWSPPNRPQDRPGAHTTRAGSVIPTSVRRSGEAASRVVRGGSGRTHHRCHSLLTR